MALATGTKLGPYEIQSPLGAGGMGEVYRARDTRLDRTVAIKILPAHLSANPEARQRFDREARAISSLNHPNICTLHDIGHQDGMDFLVMECLEGETLADRLTKGPLPTELALKYGVDICEGLEKAHKSGVLHRDLKPGNIMLTKSGAKLMDFGLAKAMPASTPLPASSLTMSVAPADQPLTGRGMIVGTFQYMSPEQIEGHEADARSDIFSLGAVLYEMASGKRAFNGKSHASIVAAILASEPQPISAIQPMSPPALDRVVRTCMAKDPDERWQTAHDVKLQLQWIAEAGSQAGIPSPVAARRKISQRLAWAIAGVAIAAAIVLGIGFVLRAPQPVHPLRVSILPPEQHSFDAYSLALSPDGTKLAFVATPTAGSTQLWVRPLDSTAAQPLAGTDDAAYPFWSPDSRSLGFFADGKLKIIDASGGAVQTLADASQPRGGAWGADGTILFAPEPRAGLLRIPAAGGTPSPAVAPRGEGPGSPRWPAFLPDGKHFFFYKFVRDIQGREGSIHLGTLGSQADTTLVNSDFRAEYANGHLVFIRSGNLISQAFDERALKLTGEAVPIAEQVRGDRQRGGAAFSLSNDGKLVFVGGKSASLDLSWYDRSGKSLGTIATGFFQDAHLSGDGKKLSAAQADSGGHLEIYIYDLVRGTKSEFSFSQSRDDDAIWSPDGSTIVFDSERSGKIDLYIRPADGAKEELLLYHDDLDKFPMSWSSDGKYIAYQAGANAHEDLWVMPMFGDRKPFLFLQEKTSTRYPAFSPDAKWIAYTSSEAGHPQVYAVSFPKPGGRFLVGDGSLPVWNRNGKEILYLDDRLRITSVDVTERGDSLEMGKPKTLFPVQATGAAFELSPDGQRLLLIQELERDSPILTLVVNWPEEVKK